MDVDVKPDSVIGGGPGDSSDWSDAEDISSTLSSNDSSSLGLRQLYLKTFQLSEWQHQNQKHAKKKVVCNQATDDTDEVED
jgi:hypothetical protein